MGRYGAAFGMLGFLGVILMSMPGSAELEEVLIRAVFWAVVCGIAGAFVGWGTRLLIRDVVLPSVDEQLARQHQEEWLLERHSLARRGGENRRSAKNKSEGRTSKVTSTDKAKTR